MASKIFSDIAAKARSFLSSRQQAYKNVFDLENRFSKAVLYDLAKFCRANETTFLPDARAHALLEGRREVWLRIEQHLNLSPEQLYEIHRVGEA